MPYYSPTTPKSIYNNEDVDERWDSTDRYFQHQDQHWESKFQKLNLTKQVSLSLTSAIKKKHLQKKNQVSPPLTGPIKEINTGCFKEDIEEDEFFNESATTTPSETREHKNNDIEEEDLSIKSISELTPLEVIQFQKQESRAPLNFKEYHSNLVQHYKDNLIHLTHSTSLFNSLPDAYKDFINNIKQNNYISLPCSL